MFWSLRRGPGANAQDQSGYTSLHHAALNGHKEIVSLLLQYEASTNVVDHKGSTPLHLAAWTGNTDIVRMLLEQGPSVPNVNLANHDRETPLHSAAQYGHTEVVSLLLKHEADPNVRNLKDESPLDLAAQYGRLETVQLLVDSDPSLLKKCTTRHSPLHLASRNGHKNVVKVLLDGGFDVNYSAESGSALHEAALYGKVEVVKLLLDYGIDVNLENNSKRTVFDLLEDLNTAISKQISRIIRDHTTAVGKVDDTSKSPYSTSPPSSFSSVSTFVPTPEKQSSLLPLVRSGSPMSEATDTICSYNSSKRSSTASDTLRKSQGSSSEHLSMSSRSPSVYETPPLPRDYDAVSVHSTSMYESRDVVTAFTESQGLSTFSPPDPQGPPSRISVPPGWKPLPPAKPPRKSITSLSPSGKTQHHIRQSSVTYDSTSQNQMMYDPSDIMMPRTPPSGFANSDSSSLHHQQPPISHSSTNQTQNASSQQQQLSNGKLSESPFSALYDEMASGKITTGGISSLLGPKAMHRRRLTGEGLRPDKPIPPAKPKTLDLRTKRQTVQIPLSPTHYQQPPTPDFPPPSPSTAALGIHEKIRPLSQEIRNKRVSRDIETLTEDELFATIDSVGHIRVSLRRENKSVSVSTDNIEEVIDDDPFAGLCRGSTVCPSSCPCDFQMSLRSQSATRQQHTYDNMLGMNTLPETRSSRNLRRESPCSDPGGQVSRSTSYDRSSVSDWGEGTAATTDSVFVRDMEETFARTLSRLRKEFQRSSFTSSFNTVEEWLKSLDLAIYTTNFVENGYDDIDFLGGNILEDDDLVDMNVSNKDHRKKILESCHSLPALKPISEGQAPESVGEWLRSLHLDQYIDTFRRNGYTDMDRTKKLWDVELKSILEIIKPGHRKRILTSLGEKSTSRLFDELKDFSLSKMDWNLGTVSGVSTTDEPSSSGDESRTVDIMRGDTSIRNFATNGSLSRNESPPLVSALKIRPPTQLMGDTSPQQTLHDMPPSFNSTQWKHQPDVLVKGSCNYTAKYLGSTLVKEVRGLESTRKSIQKLKSSTRDMNKIPNVILSISHTGVKFIDAQAKKLVCEHEIRNIHCACQDADDLNHFAYITKEHQTTNHYCHVFCAQNMDMATEIILTLGQAFEVAYQMAIREKPAKSGNKSESGTASCGDDQKRVSSVLWR
ncbi:ankyrin repeat and SAM domain-containing protein 1A [Trichonephila clavata]|uniref:Ankyrin repeat and SAM domain-containing protein 1A n=1 Tax=Trichonephila clavata TaxID=2740835 RepID=A0A8X6G0C7_TRICU|nr:ankyrin repeat and SAM domain-containing protein 1A [Trichonephila clavata]